jgi:polysaccharide pyruvyl transferase WcaK-like protein
MYDGRNDKTGPMISLDRVSLNWPLVRDFAADLLRTPRAAARRRHLLRQNQRAVGYIGWVGHDNLGDEVMFEAIRKAVRQLPMLTLFPEPGERLLAQWGLGGPALFRAVLLGGGTLINPLYLPLARLLKAQGLPIYTIGTGVGNPGFGISHRDDDSLQEWADILRESPFISVRGPLSEELLRRAGLTHVQVVGDPALALTPDVAPVFRSRPRLVINLSQENPRQRGETYGRFFQAVGDLAKHFAADGGEVVGVVLGEGDRQVLEAFRQERSLSALSIEDHRRSGESFLSTVSGAHAVISVRLHAAVLASCVGVPSLLFAYRSKCQDFMSSMGVEQLAIPVTEEANASAIRDRFLQTLSNPLLGPQLYERALFWKRKQEEYYQRLSAELLRAFVPH